ncbi:TPA: hypothetical protein CPT98_07035 [Candidatus Gastranaerophilales bacterium HUM_19]|jgi:hypothetical protein|nr:MAG TPA: hypothetical protein CPT98_07035 [Candidatus Gastranaerophilales bacterium HUM_19]DAB19503.1 MAG TPA: hypothetical protein CPT97_01940 [Candidatus Gastranaerophilales bacterium HUM_17]DAB26093.1 MAG TPA: hypothetical protein CPT86_03660 [Candidatus Gastranaerophilales bacterium HUM_23]
MKEIIKYVTFDVTPIVCVRVIETNDTPEVKQEKKDYPFKLHNDVPVHIITNKRAFGFTIPKKYIWNGADIPRLFWRLIGSKTDNAFLTASMVHDYMLENKIDILCRILQHCISMPEYRRLTSLIFREILKNSGENVIKANLMAWSVDIYQIFHKRNWKCQ